MPEQMFIADTPLLKSDAPISGKIVHIDGEDFYRIANYDQMRPFFMTLVSNSDHWLFISSTGGLSAGRKNENSALFPYYTDDKISESFETTGSKSIFRVVKGGKKFLWEPFSQRYRDTYKIKRNLLKNFIGNKIVFEEINEDLGLAFHYSWQFSDKFGFVKKSTLSNTGSDSIRAEILDGLQNILPYGVKSSMQNDKSNLVNAYKKSELDENTGLGLILLSAIIVDKAEPSEALKATTLWTSGLKPDHYLLSSRQLDNFRNGDTLETEVNKKAEPGAYFVNRIAELKTNESLKWQFIADLNQDHSDVNNLIHDLKSRKEDLLLELDIDIKNGTENLKKLVASADGLQLSNDKLNYARHFTNVLFNIMRGGIFDDGYNVTKEDFIKYAYQANKNVANKHKGYLNNLPENISYSDLVSDCHKTGDPDLLRFSFEYLPLTFSRRHGDPSRPWNKFSIETKKEDGSKNMDYQGNWRDIFQNWEALALSYPLFINSMISKFVNASTVDGYNAYRIMRDGIDWEVIEPDDPWSNIGYWGDHQIIYLLKLLEISHKHSRKDLEDLLDKDYFVYANVPYIIKPYNDILTNSKDTIEFDDAKELEAEKRVKSIGSDGKLVYGANGELLRATLTEKILLSLLTKFSNFVPEGGIWLNTQRPEWNDANNALVGNGISMVTLYYMRRYLTFCIQLFLNSEKEAFKVHLPVSQLLKEIFDCLNEKADLLKGSISDRDRKSIIDQLGKSGENYRKKAYMAFEGANSEDIRKDDFLSFFHLALQFVDHSIKANKRKDGLYHSYNLLEVKNDKASISYLYEMLEGQVSVLSSGLLSANESIELLDALKKSKIYRENQISYLLYPNRELPGFLEKNNIPDAFISNSELAKALIKNKNTSILSQDVNGNCHFNGRFTNAKGLVAGLDSLTETDYQKLVEKERQSYLEIYESMFNHKAFTGRSGTFFGYEGLGSIYWHMVSKLLLSVQENIPQALEKHDPELFKKIRKHYYEIRQGIGVHKSPAVYGAFPTDPYSHTPGNKGAQQPGMTGQVKEDIINRWAELGVSVNKGALNFKPEILNSEEFLIKAEIFEYFDVNGIKKSIEIKAGELAFTYCQVLIIYSKDNNSASIQLDTEEGKQINIEGLELNENLSHEIFARTGKVKMIRVLLRS